MVDLYKIDLELVPSKVGSYPDETAAGMIAYNRRSYDTSFFIVDDERTVKYYQSLPGGFAWEGL